MKNDFVPYEQALALKELGFDEPCFGSWQDMKEETPWFSKSYADNQNQYYGQLCSAPTFSQAFRWFRDRHQLSGTSQYFKGGYYCYTINDMKDTQESNRLFTEFENYEEAELACLIKLIEIVKNK